MKTIGDRIRNKRLELKYTLEKVANEIGVTPSTILKYENGSINIPSDKIEKIALLLKCSPAYLMGWEDKKSIIGTRLKKLRKPSDTNYISLEELAEIFNKEYNLEINKSVLAKIENGEHKIKDEILQAYSKYFNVDVNYIKGISSISKEQEAFDGELKEIIEILKFTNKSKYKVLKEILIKINKMDLEKLEAFSKII